MDLRLNRFRIAGIEMIRRIPEISYDTREVCVLLENQEDNDPQGSILFMTGTVFSFLFPNSILDPSKPDESFEGEYKMCRRWWPCMLLDQDALDDGRIMLRGATKGLAVYRGWMLKPELYGKLYDMLRKQGIILINTPEEYKRCHLFPHWYEDFRDLTPYSRWTDSRDLNEAVSLLDSFNGAVIVKDWVKSRKHEWYEACFIRDAHERKAAIGVIRRFIERQGSDMIGGVVLREYLPLKAIGWHKRSGMPLSEEYRAFFLCGRLIALTPYWEGEKGNLTDKEREKIEALGNRAKSNFFTMDVARTVGGHIIVMELGDGQVSGLQQLNTEIFYRRIAGIITCDDNTRE